MRWVHQLCAALAILFGLAVFFRTDLVYEAITGVALAANGPTAPESLLSWTALSFLRVLGALILGIGVVLLAATKREGRERAISKAILAMAMLAALATASQQYAIWSNQLGLVLVAFFLLLAAAAGGNLVRHQTS